MTQSEKKEELKNKPRLALSVVSGDNMMDRANFPMRLSAGSSGSIKKSIKTRPAKKTAYKHVPHSEKPAHLVAKRNERERKRVQAVNSAFLRLRKHVPHEPRNKRLSKFKTLKVAIDYIQHMKDLIDAHDHKMAKQQNGADRSHGLNSQRRIRNCQFSGNSVSFMSSTSDLIPDDDSANSNSSCEKMDMPSCLLRPHESDVISSRPNECVAAVQDYGTPKNGRLVPRQHNTSNVQYPGRCQNIQYNNNSQSDCAYGFQNYSPVPAFFDNHSSGCLQTNLTKTSLRKETQLSNSHSSHSISSCHSGMELWNQPRHDNSPQQFGLTPFYPDSHAPSSITNTSDSMSSLDSWHNGDNTNTNTTFTGHFTYSSSLEENVPKLEDYGDSHSQSQHFPFYASNATKFIWSN